MANIPISQLSALTASTPTTTIPVVDNGLTYKIERDALIPRAFGMYVDDIDQLLPINSATTVNINTTVYELGMELNNNVITINNEGYYLISASYQFSQGSGSADVAFWFKKNGTELSNSATHQSLTSNSKATAMVSIIEYFPAGETLELRIQTTSANTTIDNITGVGDIPDAPGVILTINQVY